MKIKNYFQNNYLAILTAFLVGFIYLAPNIFFILSLGDDYQGIPMMQTQNEDFYLARIQEIIDGHPLVASHGLYEYKDQWPTAPPTGEFFYALPSLLFDVSSVNVLIASRFVLPFILFLLIYFLIQKLTNDQELFSNKINAIAGALFITLGYDLVDYRGIFNLLFSGDSARGGFLLWARPVNPILGAIFLFAFLFFVRQIVQKTKKQKLTVFFASFFLALMFASYFFSWGIALSVAAILILIYLLKKEFKTTGNLIFVVLFAFVLALPYWYLILQSSQSEWYEESLLRSGLFYTHYPLFNKLMLAVLAFYIILVSFQILKHKKSKPNLANEESIFHFQDWHLFCLAFILGSLWAYSQQIITGRTVWPYHFVQYTIPLAIIVLMALFYNIIKKESLYLWRIGIFVIIFASLTIGIYTQANTYQKSYSRYTENQSYAKIFDWLNDKEKDCVVLVRKSNAKESKLDNLIPAFTHCNTYASSWVYTLMSSERPQFNYAIVLRLNGVKGEEIDQYLIENKNQAGGYLFSNWLGLYNYPAKDFPDFSDLLLEERLKKFPEDYRIFLKKDFKEELEKYKIDYILSVGKLDKNIINQLRNTELAFQLNDLFVYSFGD